MPYIGMMCLGVFIGSVAAVGMNFMNNQANWGKGLTIILTSTLSGTATAFISTYKGHDEFVATAWYPVGLLVALCWFYVPGFTTNLFTPGAGAEAAAREASRLNSVPYSEPTTAEKVGTCIKGVSQVVCLFAFTGLAIWLLVDSSCSAEGMKSTRTCRMVSPSSSALDTQDNQNGH